MTEALDRPTEALAGEEPAGAADTVARAALIAAVLLAGIRFLDLGRWSLWLDEAYTLADARHGESISNPVGYVLFGWFYDLAGGRPDELVLRLPAAVLGWLCVPLTAWALRPFVGRRGAAVAALVLAISPWHVYWSQNARFYTLAQAAGLAGGGWVQRGLLGGRVLPCALGAGLLGLAALVHPSAVLLGGSFLIVPWFLRRLRAWPPCEPRRGPWIVLGVALAVAALGGLPWAIDVWRKWEERQGEGNPIHFLLSAGYLVTPVVAAGALFGSWLVVRGLERSALALLAVVLAGLSAALAASFTVRVSAQYVFVFLPWIAGLAAVPVSGPAGPPARRLRAAAARLYVVVLLLPLAVETSLYFGIRNGDRPAWREAYAYVFDHRRPTDLVLGMEAAVAEYYLDPDYDDLRNWRSITLLDEFRARLPRDWARYGRRTWLVINREQLEDWPELDRAETLRILDEDCTLEASFEIPLTPRDLSVHVYLRE